MATPKRLHYDRENDYYVVLAIASDATPDAIQRAYRDRAKRLHPDLNKAPEATAQFQVLNEAYEVLHDPELRYHYDGLRAKATGVRLARRDMPPLRRESGLANNPIKTPWQMIVADWRAIARGLWRGPYRAVFMALGVVAVANITFIIMTGANSANNPLAPIDIIINATVSAEPAREVPLPAQADVCPQVAMISAPRNGDTVAGSFEIIGTAGAPYAVEWTRAAIEPDGRIQVFDWQLLKNGAAPIERAVLAGRAETAQIPATGRIRLRLTVGDANCDVTIVH